MSENEETDPHDLSPENYPHGALVLKDEFYWDCTEEFSPFGNDDGADTFVFFREWREEHPRASPVRFLKELLREWDVVDGDWEVVEPAAAKQLLKEQEFSFVTRDNTIIAVAFGQIMLGEKVDPEIKRRALLAMERQSLPDIAGGMFGEGYVPARLEMLARMRAVLEGQ